jgi:REP element-mobilizing transposase RayT
MSDHVHNLLSAADHERVNCRRRRFVTLRFEHLMQQAQEALQNLEGHVILATLMRKDS